MFTESKYEQNIRPVHFPLSSAFHFFDVELIDEPVDKAWKTNCTLGNYTKKEGH